MDPEKLEELTCAECGRPLGSSHTQACETGVQGLEDAVMAEDCVTDEDEEVPSQLPPPFDEAACEALRQACTSVIQDHPEVRSVAATVDYYGALNDAAVQKGIWLGEEGVVTTPDAILGSTMQTLRLLEEQIGRLFQVAGSMKDSLQVLGEELVKKHKETEEAEKASEEKIEEVP